MQLKNDSLEGATSPCIRVETEGGSEEKILYAFMEFLRKSRQSNSQGGIF